MIFQPNLQGMTCSSRYWFIFRGEKSCCHCQVYHPTYPGHPFQFVAPDMAHGHGVTVGFMATVNDGPVRMNQSDLAAEFSKHINHRSFTASLQFLQFTPFQSDRQPLRKVDVLQKILIVPGRCCCQTWRVYLKISGGVVEKCSPLPP